MPPDFKSRRARVAEAVKPAVLVLFSAPLAIRNNDVEHEYRQDSDFYYLTGFDEQESVLVLQSAPTLRLTLFVRPRDPERETWDGPRAGVEGAVSEFGADAAYPISELATRLPDLIENSDSIHYRIGRARENDDVVLAALDKVRGRSRLGVSCPRAIVDPAYVLHELRLHKDESELGLMDRAAEITAEAHALAMAQTAPGKYEYEIEALLRAVFRRRGSERPAYSPIVGSGPNATILHHRRNDRMMNDGELLLIDAGCEFGYYASDVTRTFPVSGKFSDPQRAVYQIVLDAQLAAIEKTLPGRTFDEVHRAAAEVVARGLIELGVIQGPLDEALEQQRHKPFFMHKTSHYLGMDVHDVGSYHLLGKPRPLSAGMVITVEPGLYFGANDQRVPEPLRGIGVRIEDDVLVTDGAASVITRAIPKGIDEVELACAG
ncbi:MAG TPA: aminopeptidase P N-terminal domain-containing protein [Polyangiaceae bacterium]|nr:aminopeptidase P N-terminal domain-containing protein [Polyangiaceae bacterium]